MSELTKKKIIEVDTGSATKNVDNLTKSFVPLKRQIKELRDEMGQLEQGTNEYNQAALKLADLQQRQVEVAEAAKYSNKDFGAVMSNLTTVSMGFAGGINAISASMALLTGDSEKMQQALAPIQLIMATLQGFSAVDNAIKSLKGLNNMLKGIGKTAETVNDNLDFNVDVDTKKADKNIKNIEKQIKSVGGKKVDIDTDTTEATTKVEELKTEIETIPDKNISIDADTTSVVESVDEVTDSLEDMADIDIEVKAEGLDNVTKEVKNLGEAEKTLTTNAQTATTATNNLNAATKSTATSTSAMAAGAKTAAVASTTLAAGEGVATKATWTLTGALKSVGVAIKSIPIIGWIAMGITLLTSLIKLIGRANKESKEGEEIARNIAMAEQDRLDTLREIERKYAKISKEMDKSINRLKLFPKGSREYNEELEKIANQWDVSTEYAETHLDKLKENSKALEKYKETQDKIEANYKFEEEQLAKKDKLERAVTTAVKQQAQTSKAMIDKLKDGTDEGIKITKKQAKELNGIQKDLEKGRINAAQAEEKAKKVVQSTTDAYFEQANAAKQANINRMNGLEKQEASQRAVISAIQTESDAYDEMLKKRKESQEAAAEYYKKYKEAQKSYIQTVEDMKIADAEYNGDWNRYADERKKKAERIYNDDLKEYERQLKEKLITQQQYDDLLNQRKEKYDNDTAQITLDTNKKMWDEELKVALDAIEKEKQAKIKANNDQYLTDVKTGTPNASDSKNKENSKVELEAINQTNQALKDRLQIILQNKDESQEYADYVKSLQDQIAENEQKATDLEQQIDEESYNLRKKQAEDYYDSIGQLEQDRMNQSFINNGGKGKNLVIEQQNIELQAIRDRMDAVKQAYEDGLITQEEYQSRSLELQAEYVQRSNEFEKQHQDNILATANTYAQTLQMIGSSISGVLQEVMAKYDENSEEYKKMAVANAVIQTISGQLGAFFSGVNSGVPAPWNFLFGGILATAALTTGLIGIANIKAGKLGGNIGGNISSSASNLGTNQYETTLYSQQNELLGNIADQRVTVLEADISNAQHNVNVIEQDNSF